MNLVLVLDTSGSMGGEPIDLLREVSLEIAGQLQEGDVVSVNEWSSSSSVVLREHEVSGPDDADLVDVLSELESGGGTDLAGGLSVGFDLAAQQYSDDRINRVVLVSDGGANLGVTSEELIGEMAGDENAVGIYLVGVGVGDATSYDDQLMDEVTDLGKGASVFVADSGDVEAFFDDRFLELMDVAARNVEVAVELPGGFEIVRTSAEAVSTERSEVPPQHLAPGASMVTHSLLEHCDADALALDEQVAVTVSWQDPWTLESHMLSYDATLEELMAIPASASLTKGAAIIAYADALRELRATSSRELLGEALDRIGTAESDNPGDAELAEMRAILEAL
ncbi:MAG: VWA domain-containing protein, partial [Proteobacteria bacterium]|nr:VWA domain-containing protein [Pseudomonadota bacterium]